MAKLLFFAIILCLACRMFFGRWPWQLASMTSARTRDIAAARALLKINADASRDEILLAHRRLVASVHPDRGGTNEQVHAANQARDLLIGHLALSKHDTSRNTKD